MDGLREALCFYVVHKGSERVIVSFVFDTIQRQGAATQTRARAHEHTHV